MAASAGSTRRARTPTSCCRREFGWRGTSRAMRSPAARATASDCACSSQVREAVASVAVAARGGDVPAGRAAADVARAAPRAPSGEQGAGGARRRSTRCGRGAAVFLADGLGRDGQRGGSSPAPGASLGVRLAGGVRGHRQAGSRLRRTRFRTRTTANSASSPPVRRTWERACAARS